MADPVLQSLLEASQTETTDPLEAPGASALAYLTSLQLSEEDIESLLGDAPGLSWDDMKHDAQTFYFRLRVRVAALVCNDNVLKDTINKAIEAGADAGYAALAGTLGFKIESVAAAALKPLVVALVKKGVSQLCLRLS